MKIKEKVLFAGFGGQGVLVAGKIFADTCVESGLYASWLPSYGPEMRGGTCNCQVVSSDEKILSPVFTRPTYLIILNQASFDRFSQRLQKAKYVVVNETLVEVPADFAEKYPNVKLIKIPATETALNLGNIKIANIIMLGALGQCIPSIGKEHLSESIKKVFEKKASIMKLNLTALEEGFIFAGK
jgi:2-oxoglutarate ferredoxin oxidoreductase subunit gamma